MFTKIYSQFFSAIFSKPDKNFYGYRDYGSFLLCKPGKDYKINANISIIKGSEPILFDAGLNREMLVLVKEALKSIKKTPRGYKLYKVNAW